MGELIEARWRLEMVPPYISQATLCIILGEQASGGHRRRGAERRPGRAANRDHQRNRQCCATAGHGGPRETGSESSGRAIGNAVRVARGRLALRYLVDTSVLSRLGREAVRAAIESRLESGELARAGISDLELGYSARSGQEWDRQAGALAVFELVETTADHLRRARQVQRALAARHQRGRKIPDLLIAAAAETENLTVLHYDADFDRIVAITGQACEWVVPAGSVD